MPDSRIAARVAWSVLAIAGFALVSLATGLAAGRAWGWMIFSLLLLAMLVLHLRNLLALGRWLARGSSLEPPPVFGVWDELHALLHRSRRESAGKHAELEEALDRWREAARALPDGVVILDQDRITWCNDTASRHLEIDPAQDAGRHITHLVRIPEFLEYLDSGDHARPVLLRPNAGRVLSVQVVEYGAGQRLVLSRDVTQFERVERMRREFIANVSHELRTPLTVIAGFIETLRDEKDADAARRQLELMDEQARRMLRLVEDLLTLSVLEASPPPLEEPVAMGTLVRRLGADARALSAGRHTIEVEAGAPFDLAGSEKELESAFGNLVSNAIRYTPEGGTIRLRWRETADGASFDVEDTGIGIPPEHIPRLTERFYRVDRGRSRETGGTGLGLAIVKHALQRHGATLHITSLPGRGSVFSARFAGARLRPATAGEPGR